jgi:hypothetical protein
MCLVPEKMAAGAALSLVLTCPSLPPDSGSGSFLWFREKWIRTIHFYTGLIILFVIRL